LVFVALEGFSGTGKTTLAKGMERLGWLRIAESAHIVPRQVPVADRADTFADYSLVGATMQYCSVISTNRGKRNIVAEGYFLSDLAYARIRYELGKSEAFPPLLSLVKRIIADRETRPDLYILLKAGSDTISRRQRRKNERERNVNEFFRSRYYTAIEELHRRLDQMEVEVIRTDLTRRETLKQVSDALRKRGLDTGGLS
jgi:thymidylate kinase